MTRQVPCMTVQAERKIPMNYANRYRNSALAQQSYLPFKVRHLAPLKSHMPCRVASYMVMHAAGPYWPAGGTCVSSPSAAVL